LSIDRLKYDCPIRELRAPLEGQEYTEYPLATLPYVVVAGLRSKPLLTAIKM